MVEVGVKMFNKCRLCRDEDGVYQIIPCINELIKDCFEIDIDPFDGLPQLICKKCKFTLTDYHAVKTKYKLKQQKLRERLIKNIKLNPRLSSETGSCNKQIQYGEPPTSLVPIVPATPPVSPSKLAEPVASVKKTLNNRHKHNRDTWKRTYHKHYFCKMCSKSYQKYSSIKRHVLTHEKLVKKHKEVFRKYCTVQLNKVDSKKNSTGSSKTVVYNSVKIIFSTGKSHYHILYLKKDRSNKNTTSEKVQAGDKRPEVAGDSSEEEITRAKKRKSRCLSSGSSTKTTNLEGATNNITDPGPRDNKSLVKATPKIDNQTSHCNKNKASIMEVSKREEAKVTIVNYKAIQDKKAQSNSETKLPVSETSLKHEVLTLGRKVIHKQGFECTGLLRYVEHRDLDISWQPATPSNKKRSRNFIRIMSKLKSRKDLQNDDSNWKDFHEISF